MNRIEIIARDFKTVLFALFLSVSSTKANGFNDSIVKDSPQETFFEADLVSELLVAVNL